MNYWIFQGNPDLFDVLGYINEQDEINWSIRQKHLASEMRVGDTVFIWMAKGSGKVSGIVAQCSIQNEPDLISDSEDSLKYWLSEDEKENAANPALRTILKVEQRCTGKKEMIKADWMKDDPILSTLRILKIPIETNYKIATSEGERLSRLINNTGKDWTRADSIAGLRAYAETYGGPLSKKSGETISNTALSIGRAVSGVYNKVLNFRSLDPRDERKGFTGGGETDKTVWKEFYDEESQSIDLDRLNSSYQAAFGAFAPAKPSRTKYSDFGEAPNDDPEELRQFALKVRKGQTKFRKKLLALYKGKCAISGSGPESVLEAAHIESHSKTGINSSENGLLLRSDLHTLFDAGLIRVHPDTLEIEIDPVLKGTSYEEHSGKTLRGRTDGKKPSAKHLKERYLHPLKPGRTDAPE